MSTRWSTKSLLVVGLGIAVAVSLPSGRAEGGQQQNAQVERGKYLVGITGCHDCHSPKLNAALEPDMARALSGRPTTTPVPAATKTEIHASLDFTAFGGPWGQTVAANLTPDATTGIGTRYNEAQFIVAMRTGKRPNGTTMQPPMPNVVYQNMTDDDLKALFAYLRSLKPIRNAVYQGVTPAGPPK
jgi:cytochrome c553